MAESWEIIHQVHDNFKGICERLARLKGKSVEWFRSHGREPKSLNPLSSGNPSAAQAFMTQCREYEACAQGAGLMLSQRVASSLQAEFDEYACNDQKELHACVLKESYDVLQKFADGDFSELAPSKLAALETEADELSEIALRIKSHARAVRRQQEMKRTELRAA